MGKYAQSHRNETLSICMYHVVEKATGDNREDSWRKLPKKQKKEVIERRKKNCVERVE